MQIDRLVKEMSTLVAITHDDPFAARDIRLTWIKSHREKLHREYGIDMEGVIAVNNNKGPIRLRQVAMLTATGEVSGALCEAGIDEAFSKRLVQGLPPNSSVLLVLVRKAATDKLIGEIKPYGGTVLQTSLTQENESKLHEALAQARQDNSHVFTNSLFMG